MPRPRARAIRPSPTTPSPQWKGYFFVKNCMVAAIFLDYPVPFLAERIREGLRAGLIQFYALFAVINL